MSILLNVRQAHVRYPRADRLMARLTGNHQPWVNVVRGVSLAIEKGETLAVVGESGSGKTTLVMALMGLVPLHRGEVEFESKRVLQGPRGRLKPDRRRVAMMFQDPVGSLSPRMTVRAALAEPFEIHAPEVKDTGAEVARLLDLVGLPVEFADRYPHQLSGGQARRIGVARALALDPALLIADEPTTALDATLEVQIIHQLKALQAEIGCSILFISHHLGVIAELCDHVVVMYAGEVVETGSVREIFHSP